MRRLDVLLDEVELARREPVPSASDVSVRGYRRLHAEHVLRADEGCNLDFLTRRPFTATAPLPETGQQGPASTYACGV